MELRLQQDLAPLRAAARRIASTKKLAAANGSPFHARKLALAVAVSSGTMPEAPALLAQEAAERGITVEALCAMIRAKAGEAQRAADAAEITYQRVMLNVEAATTVAQVEAVLREAGWAAAEVAEVLGARR